jgi:diguanylate cyclase (GGDEF)-like protein
MIACMQRAGKAQGEAVLRIALICAMLVLSIGRALAAAPAVPLPESSVRVGPYVEVIDDPEGRLTLLGARAAFESGVARQPGVNVLNFGYSRAAHWLRFRLDATQPRSGPLLLEIAFPSLDRLELYQPVRRQDGRIEYERQVTGDEMPWGQREVKHRNHVFRLLPQGADGDWIFLRVQSRSVVTVPLDLWRPVPFLDAQQDRQLGYGLFYGLVVALFLYNLMLCATLRDPAYAWYVLYVAAFGVSLATLDGFAFQYLWPENVWWANHALGTGLCVTLAFGCLFARRFLSLPANAPTLDRVFVGTIALGFAGAFFAATDLVFSYDVIMRSLSVVGTGIAALSLYVAVREFLRGYRPARFFLLAWSALLVFIALSALRNYAIVPTHFLTIYGLHVGLALDVLLLSFALADRINLIELDRKAAQAAMLDSRNALLEATRANERELERRIAERTAELFLATERMREEAAERDALLARLQEQEQHLRFMAQHDSLTGLPNRHSMQQRLALAIEIGKRNRKKVGVMLVDLNRFKQLNDTRGHATGDQALVTIAERLRTSVRGSDTVARYGGDEFVVIAADLDRAADAGHIAEKISDMVGLPVPLEGGPWKGGCSIGISVFPDDAEDALGLLVLADKAMYRVKANAETRYAFYAPVA